MEQERADHETGPTFARFAMNRDDVAVVLRISKSESPLKNELEKTRVNRLFFSVEQSYNHTKSLTSVVQGACDRKCVWSKVHVVPSSSTFVEGVIAVLVGASGRNEKNDRKRECKGAGNSELRVVQKNV